MSKPATRRTRRTWRPTTKGEVNMDVRINFGVSADLKERAEVQAISERRNLSAMMREILEAYLTEKQ